MVAGAVESNAATVEEAAVESNAATVAAELALQKEPEVVMVSISTNLTIPGSTLPFESAGLRTQSRSSCLARRHEQLPCFVINQ